MENNPTRRFGVFCAGFVLQLLPGFQTACRYKFKGFAAGTNERCAGVQCADGANIPILPEDYLTQRDELLFLNIEFLSLSLSLCSSGKWNIPVVASCANEKLQLVYKRWLHINVALPELERDLEQLLSFWLNIHSLAISEHRRFVGISGPSLRGPALPRKRHSGSEK